MRLTAPARPRVVAPGGAPSSAAHVSPSPPVGAAARVAALCILSLVAAVTTSAAQTPPSPPAQPAVPPPARADTTRDTIPRDTVRDTTRDTTRDATSDSLRALQDSLRARLERAEQAIEFLRQQLAAEAQSTVRARTRVSTELYARVLANAAFTSGGANDVAVPTFALSSTPATERPDAFTFVVRQSRFGAAMTVRDVLGGTFDGDIDFDLFGGRSASGDFPLFPVPRLRTARAWLRWPRTGLMVGSETPLVSDLDPLTLASVGVPNFTAAGNLWNWLPQFRVAQELGGRRVRWGVQGAVVSPFAGVPYQGMASDDPYAPAPPATDAAERSGLPFLQARLRARWGPEEEGVPYLTDVRDAVTGEGASEIGIGVHRGWVRVDEGGRLASTAVSIDARVVLAPRWELRGEGYVGELVAGLGGGAIGQSFGRPPDGAPEGTRGAPLSNAAGWVQLNVRPTEAWLAGVGCGVDRVDDDDRPSRRRNTACAAHVRWRPIEPLLFGLEYRRLSTLYPTGTFGVNHVNLALGFEL